jgi:hypothetical protein
MPPTFCCQVAALMIGSRYYFWRDLYRLRIYNSKLLRERVTYMLWVAANR